MTKEFVQYQKMCAAVIEHAIADYRACVRRGLIARGKLTGFNPPPPKRNQRNAFTSLGMMDARELLDFFADGGGCEAVLRFAHLNLSGDAIRARVSLL